MNIEHLIHSYKGTVINRPMPSLHGGSLEISLTVTLKVFYLISKKTINVPRRFCRQKKNYAPSLREA